MNNTKKKKSRPIKPSLDVQYFIDQSSDESVRKMQQELMVGKYIEECRNAKTGKPPKRDAGKSPYVYTADMNSNNSNGGSEMGDSCYNKQISQITASKFLPHPPRGRGRGGGTRPESAPVYRLGIGYEHYFIFQEQQPSLLNCAPK